MNKLARPIALVAALLLAAGCASRHEIRHDQDPSADLKSFKTFGFYEFDDANYVSLLETRLRHATRQQMERQHYVYDATDPDLRVNYALQVVDRQELKSTSHGPGYRGWNALETAAYRQGTLIVDLVDAKRNTLVWRAVAEGRVDDKAAREPGPTIDAVVGELFTGFPATAAK